MSGLYRQCVANRYNGLLQSELASSTLYMVQKNELLTRLKAQIKELNNLNPDYKKQELQQIESTLQKSMYLNADWAKFKLHFEQVHPHFFTDLQSQHPTLTKNPRIVVKPYCL